MSRSYTVKAYRAIDLTLFAVILCIFETVIVRASSSPMFRDQPYSVSLAAAITTIVYYRWGWWGCIHALLGGIAYSGMGGGSPVQMAVYALGNLLSLFMVPIIRKAKPSQKWFCPLSGLGTLLLMQTGRAIAALLIGAQWAEALRFFTTDSLSAVFTLVILWIAHRLDGICEDQKQYLKRINQQIEE